MFLTPDIDDLVHVATADLGDHYLGRPAAHGPAISRDTAGLQHVQELSGA
jgi:hypothetical protein